LRSWPTLANRFRLPRAGVNAELEGVRVAAAIAADVQGGDAPPPFDGSGYCFIEMGHAAAALVDGDGYATPEPRGRHRGARRGTRREKRLVETERLRRWFGA
jgi:sulfide:quinone oxidoreductase